VGPRERRTSRGRRLASRSLVAIGEELREARFQAGLTQRQASDLAAISPAEVSRIERGQAPWVPYRTLVLIGAVLGLDLSLRAFPNGDRVRDAGQLALMSRIRSELPATIRLRPEVPLGIPGGRRAWDGMLIAAGWTLPVEAETRLRDVQMLLRRLSLKSRDAGAGRLLLVVADTRHNRHVLRIAADEFAETFPVPGRRALAAIKRGQQPEGSSLLLL
jgi:transcriptional regulator with XRE-family HTH domain